MQRASGSEAGEGTIVRQRREGRVGSEITAAAKGKLARAPSCIGEGEPGERERERESSPLRQRRGGSGRVRGATPAAVGMKWKRGGHERKEIVKLGD
jgi:hypothetical protein